MITHAAVLDCERDKPARERAFAAARLDARSFHLFERDGVRYLYDVSSGRLAEVNELLSRLLELCAEHPWEEVEAVLAREWPGWDAAEARAAVDELCSQGFFRYEPVDVAQQRGFLDVLWRHRPRRIQLLMAQMCNLKCLYCYEEHNGSNARKRLMSFEMAKEAVDYLVERSGPRRDLQVTFFGGEPLLNKATIYRVVEYCEGLEETTDKRFTFELITNGTLLSREVVDYLIEHRFMLMISLDGDREMNNFNRPSVSGRDYHDTIVENACYADRAYKRAKLGMPVKVRANLTHEHHDLRRTVRYLEGLGFTTIGVSTVDDLPWSEGKLHACTEEDLDDIARQSREMIEEGLEELRAGRRPSPYVWKRIRKSIAEVESAHVTRGLRCGVGRNTNIVDTDGDIYPCHRYGDMQEYVLGNVKDRALDRERTMAYYRTVNRASTAHCEDCWARYICGGPCAWEVSNPNGTVHAPEEGHCRRVKEGIEQTLVLRKRMQAELPEHMPSADGCGACSCGSGS